MSGDELLSIGRFARLALVSVHTLRHYDEVGLLTPAAVDPVSGYRRYHRAQIRDARLIQALRGLDLPIEDVRRVLEARTGDAARVLEAHRDKLERQHRALASRISSVDRFLAEGIPMPTVQSGCRPVQIGIGLLVGDLDTAHSRAVAAGATEVVRPRDGRSAVRDPSGNWIGLEQGDTSSPKPASVTLAVDDEGDAKAFYSRTFGDYDGDAFAVHLLDDKDRFDRPGPSGFSFLVEDLDAFHARALEAGATEVIAPREAEGMPRHSTFKDPSGNTIGLAQG
jgi:DNA-binding transcriptional MerR regulator